MPPGMKEIDICFKSEQAYQRFWALSRAAFQIDSSFLHEFNMIPLFRGETRVVTVFFRTTTIPEEDLALFLERHCKILQKPEKKLDELGYWTGEFRMIVALGRDPYTGRLRHLPKYFFLGAERGVTRYSGQPPACFQCGGFDHFRKNCVTELCSRCGVRGHRTTLCRRPITCSLCAEEGHAYRLCPQSVINIEHPEVFQRERERAENARRQEEEERERRRLRRDTAVGRDVERPRKDGKSPPPHSEQAQDQTALTPENESGLEGEGWVQVAGSWKTIPKRGKEGNRRGDREKVTQQSGPSGTRFQALAVHTEDEDSLVEEESQSEDLKGSHSEGHATSKGARKRQGDKRSPLRGKVSKQQRDDSLERKKVKRVPAASRKEADTKAGAGKVELETPLSKGKEVRENRDGVVSVPSPVSAQGVDGTGTGSDVALNPETHGESSPQVLPQRIPRVRDPQTPSKATPREPVLEGVETVVPETPEPVEPHKDTEAQENMEVQEAAPLAPT